jgi:ADP-ribosylglycohydrolase
MEDFRFQDNLHEKMAVIIAASKKDRILGCIMGMFVGDALAMGCHWDYDGASFKTKFGENVREYLAPLDDSYHPGLSAGSISQPAQLTYELLQSMASTPSGELDQENFNSRFDALLETLDGTGPGGRYTSGDIRHVYKKRVVEQKSWDDSSVAFLGADTTDILMRAALIGIRYNSDIKTAVQKTQEHARFQIGNPVLVSQASVFAAMVALLVRGEALFDSSIETK